MTVNNKLNLDLIFLYQKPLNRDYSVLDNDVAGREWTHRYEKQRKDFRSFVKQCSLANLAYIFIRSFAVEYPKVTNLGFSIGDIPLYGDEGLKKFEDFIRPDIKNFESELYLGPVLDPILMPNERDLYDIKRL
jgi:hypothetical protein